MCTYLLYLSTDTASQKTTLCPSYNSCPPPPVWRGDKKRFNRWPGSQPTPSCLAGCLSKGRAIRSPLKYVSPQTMVFPDPFSRSDNALGLPKHTQPSRRAAGKIWRKKTIYRECARSKRYLEMAAVHFFYLPPQGGNSPTQSSLSEVHNLRGQFQICRNPVL